MQVFRAVRSQRAQLEALQEIEREALPWGPRCCRVEEPRRRRGSGAAVARERALRRSRGPRRSQHRRATPGETRCGSRAHPGRTTRPRPWIEPETWRRAAAGTGLSLPEVVPFGRRVERAVPSRGSVGFSARTPRSGRTRTREREHPPLQDGIAGSVSSSQLLVPWWVRKSSRAARAPGTATDRVPVSCSSPSVARQP